MTSQIICTTFTYTPAILHDELKKSKSIGFAWGDVLKIDWIQEQHVSDAFMSDQERTTAVFNKTLNEILGFKNLVCVSKGGSLYHSVDDIEDRGITVRIWTSGTSFLLELQESKQEGKQEAKAEKV